MSARRPLSVTILLWFALNVAVLAVLLGVLFRQHLRPGLDALIAGAAGERIESLSGLLVAELGNQPRREWDGILARYAAAYHVQFCLYRLRERVAGNQLELPPEVRTLVDRPRWPGVWRGGPEAGAAGTSWGGGMDLRPYPKRVIRTRQPTRYWVLVRAPLGEPGQAQRWPGTLVLMSNSFRLGGLLFDATPWLIAGLGGLGLSVLLWLPVVRGITRAIAQMTAATGRIAEGRFDVRVEAGRHDDLGQLAEAINGMASRLAAHVEGQKRFLGDVAHELCTPLSRIQMAVGILDQRSAGDTRPYVEDLRQEVEAMSDLVNELLAFSRATLQGKAIPRQPVELAEVVQRAVQRETGGRTVELRVGVGRDLQVLADKDLLGRAVGNLVRNAVRYAGSAGPIEVEALVAERQVRLQVSDVGPGLPPEALAHLFTPFYRPDPSRRRETGGTGLGLAIVKTCVEACGGTVTCANRQPCGLRFEMVLERA